MMIRMTRTLPFLIIPDLNLLLKSPAIVMTSMKKLLVTAEALVHPKQMKICYCRHQDQLELMQICLILAHHHHHQHLLVIGKGEFPDMKSGSLKATGILQLINSNWVVRRHNRMHQGAVTGNDNQSIDLITSTGIAIPQKLINSLSVIGEN